MKELRLRYQTIEFGQTDIHLCTLRDRQQFYDPEGIAEALGISSALWPIFGTVWPSSLALAQFVHSYPVNNKRVLEIGCGMALPSLLLNVRGADITATDFHPEVQTFLNRNTAINESPPIPFERTSWEDDTDTLGTFDLLIGSDLLYEDEHIRLLANFINNHANDSSEVIIVDPGRGRKSKLITEMSRFGYTSSYQSLDEKIAAELGFKGHILKFDR